RKKRARRKNSHLFRSFAFLLSLHANLRRPPLLTVRLCRRRRPCSHPSYESLATCLRTRENQHLSQNVQSLFVLLPLMGSQGKLTRSPSSFLRSSPTVRSSIHSLHSLSSMAEEDLTTPLRQPAVEDDDDDKQKGKEDRRKRPPHRCGSSSTRFTPVLTMVSIAFFSFFTLSFFLFFYLRREEIPASENLLLGLIFIAVTLFFGSKNKSLINQNLYLIKQLWDENGRRFCVFASRSGGSKTNKQVKWFIGESDSSALSGKEEERVIREGVEFYSNGDYYEGEFHKGKCNGSGVYNFFVNGRYEGDWIDGRYDGYGIESWARGSRYRGQYRQGLRHGYGVYRFFTGDSYAGEWCNGQSHGFGVQTCADGSCYVGEFKCGVKHGLGVYHFRFDSDSLTVK
ncbi:Phosphatidylinositol 4-phosphate 5-kinase 9, partial [Linum grandiflorum]